jgi:hypothetical protein
MLLLVFLVLAGLGLFLVLSRRTPVVVRPVAVEGRP